MPVLPCGLVLAGNCIVEEAAAVVFPVGVDLIGLKDGGYMHDTNGDTIYRGPHAVLEYPPKDDPGWRAFGTRNPAHRFEAGERVEGFSGGGIWRIASQGNPARLWTPRNEIRLCGIQSFWMPHGRKLGAVPISEWITMMKYEMK